MSRLNHASVADASDAARIVFEQVKKAVGKVPNAYATIGALSPASLNLVLAGDSVLGTGALSKQDIEAVRLAISSDNGCDYCVAAHSFIGKMVGLKDDQLRQLRDGQITGDVKRDALVRFALSVNESSGTVPAPVVSAVLDAGYTPTQIVETLLVISLITFTNLVNRVNDTQVDFPIPQ